MMWNNVSLLQLKLKRHNQAKNPPKAKFLFGMSID